MQPLVAIEHAIAVPLARFFEKNFPYFTRDNYRTAEIKMRKDLLLKRLLKIKRGYCLNHAPEYFGPTNLDPRYFAFLLELI